MTEEKKKECQERYRFWSDKRISQFSFQNNIFLTVGLAIMGFFWNQRDSVYTKLIIDWNLKIELKVVFFLIGIIILFYSIIIGLFLAVSRLYDLRLTSNILLTRKRMLAQDLTINYEKCSNNSVFRCAKSFWLVFGKFYEVEIISDEIRDDNTQLQSKFTTARQLSKDLGKLTWVSMQNQTVSLFISICFFLVVLILK